MTMIHPKNALLLSILLLGSTLAWATESGPDGRQILQEFISRHQLPYEFEEMTVKMIDGQGNEQVREMRRYTRKWDEGKFRHLLVFDAPSSIKGTALLGWQQGGKPDQQWVYLPAFGKVRKQGATQGSSRKYFMGTDLTYEDISPENPDKYDYQRQADQVLDGVDHFVVRAMAADEEMKAETGYQYRELFLRKDNYVLVRVDYYDLRGNFIKRSLAKSEPVEVADGAWRVDHVVLENEKENHRTELLVKSRDTSEDAVSRSMFSPHYLSNKRHMK